MSSEFAIIHGRCVHTVTCPTITNVQSQCGYTTLSREEARRWMEESKERRPCRICAPDIAEPARPERFCAGCGLPVGRRGDLPEICAYCRSQISQNRKQFIGEHIRFRWDYGNSPHQLIEFASRRVAHVRDCVQVQAVLAVEFLNGPEGDTGQLAQWHPLRLPRFVPTSALPACTECQEGVYAAGARGPSRAPIPGRASRETPSYPPTPTAGRILGLGQQATSCFMAGFREGQTM